MTRRRAAALLLWALLLCGCAAPEASEAAPPRSAPMPLRYAEQFTVDRWENGAALVTVAGEDRFLLLPEGAEAPEGWDAAVLRVPLDRIYVASSSAMDPFRRLGALNAVSFAATEASAWSLPEVVSAMESGEILYAGKYRAPDYELLASEGCKLAVENTMIYHSPATKEQLEDLGIPVLVERSSYESHPLGRMEWIKLYGLLTGREAEAEAFFDGAVASLSDVLDAAPTGKSAAFFYLSPNGGVNVRRSGDYVARMIELAGGTCVPRIEGEDARSAVTMQFEAFYAAARDADVLIYNANIYPLDSLDRLLAQNELLADFKAVREGNVYLAGQNLFQETTAAAEMIADFRAVLSGEGDGALRYLTKLR